MYIHGTYTFIIVYICIYIVQARLYCRGFNPTLHFSSGPISLATPASLSPPQATLLQSSLRPLISLLSSVSSVSSSKLPQPLVYLIHIAELHLCVGHKILLGQLVKSSMCIDVHGTYHVCIMHMHVYTLTIQYRSMYIKCMYLHACSCTYTVQTMYIPCIYLACTMLPSHEHAMNMNFKM